MNRSPKLLWVAFALALMLGILWELCPLHDASVRLAAFPLHGIRVIARDIPMEPAEQAIFSGVTVVKRLVSYRDHEVIVTVVDGTRRRHAVHDPVFCFRGAGWSLDSRQSLPMKNGEASLVELRQDNQRAEALYWFSDGAGQFASPMRYWLKTSLRRLSLGYSGAEPVLVILTASGGTPMDWPQLLRDWPELQEL